MTKDAKGIVASIVDVGVALLLGMGGLFAQIGAVRSDLGAQIGAVRSDLGAQVGDLRERMARVETRLDGVETRLDGMDARLDGMDARLDGMDARLASIEGAVLADADAAAERVPPEVPAL